MRYRVEYAESKYFETADNQMNLIQKLKTLKKDGENITDVRKEYKNGMSKSVLGKYEQYITKGTLWIIRFSDNTLASCFGSKRKAKELAERKKDLYGGSYIII